MALTLEQNGSVNGAPVGLIAYAVGLNQVAQRAEAYSGIASGANVGAIKTSGTATYDVNYAFGVIDGVSRTPTSLGGSFQEVASTPLTLTANFGTQELLGSDTNLNVLGTISGTSVGGNVIVTHSAPGQPTGTLSTALQGQIGDAGVIGAFHGADSNTVAAGGFVGTCTVGC